MTSLQYPYMIIKVFFFNIMFALCLYQLCTDRSPGISQTRVYRVVGEFVGIAAIFFYLCHCSERLDDCNRKLHRACIGCDWWRLSPQVRRTLLMITRIAQKPNHFCLAYRAQVLDYAFFVSMAKFSYSFVNFMRFRAKP